MSDDFASMMQQTATVGGNRTQIRIRPGQVVEGTIVQIGQDSVFVDIGTTTEARIDRREFESAKQEITVKVGDTVKASVVSAGGGDSPVLTVALGKGKGRGLDEAALHNAKEARLPVEGLVEKVVKSGVEVSVLGARAFCPASQIDSEFVKDLSAFDGQKLEFLITEVKNGGRDVIVSRKALLLEKRSEQAAETLSKLVVGEQYQATVVSTQKYGAFVDLGGGVEGLVHISELAHGRTDRVEDVVGIGETVTVKLLDIQPGEKRGAAPRIRLSLRALTEADNPAPEKGEVLDGTVTRVESFGVFVETSKGAGLVPTRELDTPRGSDSRRIFPIGTEVRVVLVSNDPSRGITFSIARVAGVEERHNYREFTRALKGTAEASSGMGSFGALLRRELNLPEPQPEAEPAAPAAPATAARAASPASAPTPAKQAVQPKAETAPGRNASNDGVIRGRRRPGQADALRDSERRRTE